MKRRSALKSLTLTLGGMTSLPVWASRWTPESIGKQTNIANINEELLAEIVETIIPETNSPGAKSLKVHQFALRMINDCYDEKAQTSLKNGLVKTEDLAQSSFAKSFIACDSKQRQDVFLKLINDSSTKSFAEMIKNLTIRGYTNSEYFMNNMTDYNMAPGFYHGCVAIKK